MIGSTKVSPVLLCGGSGTRLWPLSRRLLPKQFAPLTGPASLLEVTCRRVSSHATGSWFAVCNADHRFLVAEELSKAGVEGTRILLEPVARNTAPAIAAAALAAQSEGDDPILVVLPSDHIIDDTRAFGVALERAIESARSGSLVTFGIAPTHPATGYGYIKTSNPRAEVGKVEAFVEKPDEETARRYIESGGYLWNSGIFVFRASRFMAELGAHRPEMAAAVGDAWASRTSRPGFVELGTEAFAGITSESVDYAVMENTTGAKVVTLDAGWNDVGSWKALWDIGEHDAADNVLSGDCVAVDVRGSYIRSERRLVAAVGLRDHLVVETADSVLVAPLSHAQEVKALVDTLTAKGRPEVTAPPRVPRPWGDYESLDTGDRYQVKRITVSPGAALSVQKHHHRAEHWTVVEGRARVLCDNAEFELVEGESTFIPLGAIHRLENPGTTPLVLIEVQCGAYLGEDDIVRFEDRYGRVGE